MNADEKNKRVQNLFRSPQNDPKSAFYTINRLTKSLIKKAKTSFYDKDKVFVNLYGQIEDKDFFKKENETLPLVTPFVDEKLILTIRLYAVFMNHSKCCMQILLIYDF